MKEVGVGNQFFCTWWRCRPLSRENRKGAMKPHRVHPHFTPKVRRKQQCTPVFSKDDRCNILPFVTQACIGKSRDEHSARSAKRHLWDWKTRSKFSARFFHKAYCAAAAFKERWSLKNWKHFSNKICSWLHFIVMRFWTLKVDQDSFRFLCAFFVSTNRSKPIFNEKYKIQKLSSVDHGFETLIL